MYAQARRKVSDLLSTRLAIVLFRCDSIILFLIIVNHYNIFFSFKNHQQWWQQARAQRAENEKDSVIESEKCDEQISGICDEDPVVDGEHSAHPVKRRKVSLGGL